MARQRSVSRGLAEFLDQETFLLTVNGAIGRNKTYRDEVHTKSRRAFRKSLRRWLYDRVGEYEVIRIGDERHVANIERLSSAMSKSHGDILFGGTLRFGTAQKALNLYLKYCWARGLVAEPPHCPIDSIVLANVEKCARDEACRICSDVTWTKIRSTHEYMHFVEKARARALEAGKSLASWELGIWQAACHCPSRPLAPIAGIDGPTVELCRYPRRVPQIEPQKERSVDLLLVRWSGI